MLAMKPKNHPNHRRKRGGVDDATDDRETPADVFDPLHAEFSFTLDAAAARHNAKCKRYYALGPGKLYEPRQLSIFPEEFVGDEQALGIDGLRQPWGEGERVWVNPPFSDIAPWVQKATWCAATVAMLLPANRCEQPWWQEYIEPFRDGRALTFTLETRFLAGRRCFLSRGQEIKNRTSKSPPWGIVIVIWDRRWINGPANDT